MTFRTSLYVAVGIAMSLTNSQAEGGIPAEYSVRMERDVRIPMRDGKSLSADLTRPDVADDRRFPILIEYHPYRKDDVSWSSHDAHWYLAERGFIGGVSLSAASASLSGVLNLTEGSLRISNLILDRFAATNL